MPDSFSELRDAGGSNKPWIAAGVGALAVSLILIALTAAWWYAQPASDTDAVPGTVTVTAQASASMSPADAFPAGTYSGTLVSLDPNAKTRSWPAVAVFGGGTGSVTYPTTGCTALIDATSTNHPLTEDCRTTPGVSGTWDVDASQPGLVHLTYAEGGNALVEGTLSAGMPR